jgi:hypothetical protein
MARMVEGVRSYGAAVLVPQALKGQGWSQAAARILNASHTVILHAVPDPDAIIKAAGTRMATERSLQHERGISTDVGSTRTQHQTRIDLNGVRRLGPGMCFLISNGRARSCRPQRHARTIHPTASTSAPSPSGPPMTPNPRGRSGYEDLDDDSNGEKLLTADDVAASSASPRAWVYAETRRNAIPHLAPRPLRPLPPGRDQSTAADDEARPRPVHRAV